MIWARERDACIVLILCSVARVFVAWRASANRTTRKPEGKGASEGKDEALHQTTFFPAREAQIQKLDEAEPRRLSATGVS